MIAALLLAAAVPVQPLAPSDRREAEEALAMLPPALAEGLQLAADPRADCDPDTARVDPRARRIEICTAAAPNGRPSKGHQREHEHRLAREHKHEHEHRARTRRQVLIGALQIWDDRAGWSRIPAWWRYNGWSRAATSPWRWVARNESPAAYAAPAGRHSPDLDLATFAAGWILERQAPGAEGADRPLECRLLPQAMFLHAHLRALPALPGPLQAPPRCRAFEAWARRDRIAALEIALATPSTVSMASMFGHVFLRLVETPEPDALEDRTLAFLVDNHLPVTEDPFYAWKGIAGAYQATLLERPLLDTYRTYVVEEGRDLRRYRLHLSPAETEALLQRLWSLRQAGAYRYFFFGTNCATLMVDLINSVLPDDRQVRFPEALATTPAGTLEGYARAAAASGRPLLTFIPETLLSFEHQARLAAIERERLWRKLDPTPLQALWNTVRTGGPEERARAYRALASGPLAAHPATRELLRHSVIVELHLSARANLTREQALLQERRHRLRAAAADLRARLHPHAPSAVADTASDDLAIRLRGYRQIAALVETATPSSDDLRRLALLESEVRYDDHAFDPALRDALFFPERDRTLGQQRYAHGLAELIDHPFVTDISAPLLALQQAQAALPPQLSPAELRRRERATRRQEEIRFHEAAVPRTGIDEVTLGIGLDLPPAGARPLLLLGGAMHDERLGDQRRFGFPPNTALTVLRTRTALALDGARRWPALAAWEAQLLGYRALPPPGANGFGGEGYVDLGGRPRLGRTTEVRAGGGWLLPLLASPRLADHLILGAGLLGTVDRLGAPAQTVWGLGGSLGLEARHALDPANQAAWVSARAQLRPLWTSAGLVRELTAGAELRLPVRERVRLPLAPDASSALSLRLQADLFASTLRGPADVQLGLALALE